MGDRTAFTQEFCVAHSTFSHQGVSSPTSYCTFITFNLKACLTWSRWFTYLYKIWYAQRNHQVLGVSPDWFLRQDTLRMVLFLIITKICERQKIIWVRLFVKNFVVLQILFTTKVTKYHGLLKDQFSIALHCFRKIDSFASGSVSNGSCTKCCSDDLIALTKQSVFWWKYMYIDFVR